MMAEQIEVTLPIFAEPMIVTNYDPLRMKIPDQKIPDVLVRRLLAESQCERNNHEMINTCSSTLCSLFLCGRQQSQAVITWLQHRAWMRVEGDHDTFTSPPFCQSANSGQQLLVATMYAIKAANRDDGTAKAR
jgi:hypothetical protein